MSKKLIAGAGVVASFAVALAPLATFATDYVNPRGHTDRLSVTIEQVCAFGYTTGSTQVVVPGTHTDGANADYSGDLADGTQSDTPSSGHAAGKGYGAWELASGTTTGQISTYDYTTTTTTDDTYTEVKDVAYGIMENNTYNDNFASTRLNIVCNNKNGYTLTAYPTDLTRTGESTDKIAAGGHTAETADSKWSFKVAATDRTGTGEDADWAAQTNTNTLASSASSWSTTTDSNSIQLIALTSDAGVATPSLGDSFTVTYGVGVSSTLSAGTYEGDIRYIVAQI